MDWRDSVLAALKRYSARHSTRQIRRQRLIDEELDRIIDETGSVGVTPPQTLSRVLQDLRDEGLVHFAGGGSYLLVDTPVPVEFEDLPDESLDWVVRNNKLAVSVLPTGDQHVLARRRRGQSRLRRATLENYGHQCAICDIAEPQLLVAGHISRWADDVEGRGDLTNLICLCKFHDALFEAGFFTLADDYRVLRRTEVPSEAVSDLLAKTVSFRTPRSFPPGLGFLRNHRMRCGFD